jgi:hypothetical protein
VNKRADLQTMTGDIVFSEFKIDHLQMRVYSEPGTAVGQRKITAQKTRQNLLSGKLVWTDTFVKQGGEWRAVASQVIPMFENNPR